VTRFEVASSAGDVIGGRTLVVEEGVEAAELAIRTGRVGRILLCSAASCRRTVLLAGDKAGNGNEGDETEKELHSGNYFLN
jgi:hypothetical protein